MPQNPYPDTSGEENKYLGIYFMFRLLNEIIQSEVWNAIYF